MNVAYARVMTVRTPEGISFTLPLAGPIHRAFALLLDLFCILVASSTIASIGRPLGLISHDAAFSLYILANFVLGIGYFIVMEWRFRGQTIGKRLLRLRVMDDRGRRLTFDQVVIRTLFRAVDAAPALYLVGGVACVLNRHGKRIGDLVANTIVVCRPKVVEPDLSQIVGGKYNSFWDYPHIVARYRQRVSPEEAQLALAAVLRREEFEPAARIALFADVARHFRTRYPAFPAEACAGLTDEQHVRNLVEILFQPRARPS